MKDVKIECERVFRIIISRGNFDEWSSWGVWQIYLLLVRLTNENGCGVLEVSVKNLEISNFELEIHEKFLFWL